MALTNRTQYAILGALTIKPMSGYDIKQFIETSIAFFWNENYGHLYPVLKQLEKAGWIIKLANPEDTGRKRCVYSLTEQGRLEFRQWLAQPLEPSRPRMELLFKLFFGEQIPDGDSIRRIKERRTEAEIQWNQLTEVLRSLQGKLEKAKNRRMMLFKLMTLEYGIALNRAIIDWSDKYIPILEKLEKEPLL